MTPRKTSPPRKRAAPKTGGTRTGRQSTRPEPPASPTATSVAQLGERGGALWTELTAGPARFNPAQTALAIEACRIADRLDLLDAILRGDFAVDKALAEARMQAVALRQIVDSLALPALPAADSDDLKGDPADELAKQRATRRAAGAVDPAGSSKQRRSGSGRPRP